MAKIPPAQKPTSKFRTLFGTIICSLICLTGCTTNQADNASPAIAPSRPEIILPPAWAFGVLWGGYTSQQQTIERVDHIVAESFPIDAYWIDSHFWDFENTGRGPDGYLDFVGDRKHFPDPAAMWEHQHQLGIKSGIWVWPHILKTGNETVFEEWAADPAIATVKEFKSSWHNKGPSDDIAEHDVSTPTANPNWSNPDARAKWGQSFQPLFEAGLDFFKPDSWAMPDYVRACFEATQTYGQETRGRGFVLSNVKESQNPASLSYPGKWTADTAIAWSYEAPLRPDGTTKWPHGGFRQNIEWITSPEGKAYGYPFMTCDGGGYTYWGGIPEIFDDELYLRWLQFCSWLPLTEIFSAHTVPHSNLPWYISERAVSISRNALHFRQRLFPYIYSSVLQTRIEGQNIVRSDGENLYQYGFGDAFLIGPVITQGANSKDFHLPAGIWIDYHTGERHQGRKSVTVPAPIDYTPTLVRAGSLVPLRDYHRNIEGGSNDPLTVKIFTGDKPTHFNLYEDDGLSNDYLNGKVSVTKLSHTPNADGSVTITVAPAKGSFEGLLTQRTVIFEIFSDWQPIDIDIPDGAETLALGRVNAPYDTLHTTRIRVSFPTDLGTQITIKQ